MTIEIRSVPDNTNELENSRMVASNSSIEAIRNPFGVEKLYDDIVWTHKIHEKQADIYSTNGRRLQKASIACIAITAVLAGVGIGVSCVWLNIAATIFAVVATFVSIYREAKPYDVLVCDHSSYAKDYLALREELTSILTKAPLDKEAVNCIRCKYIHLCDHAPRTTDKAEAAAETAIENGEGKLFSQCFEKHDIKGA